MNDPLSKRYCYAFDEFGVFTGMVRRREINGELVALKNSCDVKPILVEGCKAVWNGYSWDYMSVDSPLMVARRLLPGLSAALDEKKAAMLEGVIRESRRALYDDLKECLERKQNILYKELVNAQSSYLETVGSQYARSVRLVDEFNGKFLECQKLLSSFEIRLTAFLGLSLWRKILVIFGLIKLEKYIN